jgi:hypothetical protein
MPVLHAHHALHARADVLLQLQLQLTPTTAIRGIRAPGAGAPVFSVHDFLDVVAQALARNVQIHSIYQLGHHTPVLPRCPCGGIDACEHTHADRDTFARNCAFAAKRDGFAYAMSSQDMLARRGTWSLRVRNVCAPPRPQKAQTAQLRCWLRPSQNRMSVVQVMTVPDLHALLLRVGCETARTHLELSSVISNASDFADSARFNAHDEDTRKHVAAVLARFIAGDHSMLTAVSTYSDAPAVRAKRKRAATPPIKKINNATRARPSPPSCATSCSASRMTPSSAAAQDQMQPTPTQTPSSPSTTSSTSSPAHPRTSANVAPSRVTSGHA